MLGENSKYYKSVISFNGALKANSKKKYNIHVVNSGFPLRIRSKAEEEQKTYYSDKIQPTTS